jgi:Helix-turn-helix
MVALFENLRSGDLESRLLPALRTHTGAKFSPHTCFLGSYGIIRRPFKQGKREMPGHSVAALLNQIPSLGSWCKANGVSQKDLAARMAISPQRLNDMMTGRRNTQPTGEQVLQLLEILKTKPARKKKTE